MLVPANRLLTELAEQRRVLMEDTFRSPPEDYAKFLQAVGKVQSLDLAMDLVRNIAKIEDER